MTFSDQYSPRFLFAILATLFLTAFPLSAHENSPSIVDLALDGRTVTLTVQTNLEAIIAGTAAEHESGGTEPGADEYLQLRQEDPDHLFKYFDRKSFDTSLIHNETPIPLTYISREIPLVGDTALPRLSTITFTTELPATTGTLTWQYPAKFGDSILRLYTPENTKDPILADYVAAGKTATIDLTEILPQTLGAIIWDYIVAGFDHIIPKGLDHILFVIGLFLLSAHLRPLLTQVTMFTIAHTITLALGATGYVNLPGNIVEPLIAASIIFVAVENIFTEKLSPWRPLLIFGFGLLHGLGFASVLGDFGLPAAQFIPALIAFNIGVEIGQLTVIAACFLAFGLWFRNKDWYHRVIVIPASTAIAIIATYWLLQRTGFVT